MSTLRAALAFALATASAPVALHGQGIERSPFHARQWGTDFIISSGFAGVGLIHFRTPDRALVLDLTGDVASTTSQAGAGTGNSNNVSLSLGMRRYRPVAPSVEFFHTLGIVANYSHSFTAGGAPSTGNEWGAGLFGEAGAGWMVSPHLLLGANWRVNALYAHSSTTTAGGTASAHRLELSLNGITLTGQLFF